MRKSDFPKKVRFSAFLPYGLISTPALDLSISASDVPGKIYDPNMSMEDRISRCTKDKANRQTGVWYMEKYGYIEHVNLKYGSSPAQELRMYRLTKSGLYLLSNTHCEETETKRLSKVSMPKNRRKKEENNSYLAMDSISIQHREILLDLTSNKRNSTDDYNRFIEFFWESVYEDDLSLLATEAAMAKVVSTIPNLKAQQIYRAWRQMNLESMFRSINCLTSIDRRHLNTRKNTINALDEHSKGKAVDIKIFTDWVLKNWYDEQPDSYKFLDPLADKNEINIADPEKKTVWEQMPAYYSVHEMPGFRSEFVIESKMNPRGANNLLRYNCSGVAIGRKTNYMVYHTRQTGTPWSEPIERDAAIAAQQTLDIASEEGPVFGAGRTIENALIVCPTVYQFASLFENAKRYLARELSRQRSIGVPFNTVCIVPVNHSGIHQLSELMESNPIQYDEALVSKFVNDYDDYGFARNYDFTYPLRRKDQPVLLAHSMNFQRLYNAYRDYLSGKRFLVACFPEQVKFIKKIMPDLTFI